MFEGKIILSRQLKALGPESQNPGASVLTKVLREALVVVTVCGVSYPTVTFAPLSTLTRRADSRNPSTPTSRV